MKEGGKANKNLRYASEIFISSKKSSSEIHDWLEDTDGDKPDNDCHDRKDDWFDHF